MRKSILTKDDLGELVHDKKLTVGTEQSMIFQANDTPPIFDPTAEKLDQQVAEINKIRKLTAVELRNKLEDKGLNSAGRVKDLVERAKLADIPITESSVKIIPGYIDKPKGALQIACERGLIDQNGKVLNGKKASLSGTKSKDAVTGVVSIDKETSVLRLLQQCSDFKNEQTQMSYILGLLDCKLKLTPKCHPEIAGRGIEYAWGYAKLRFRSDFNDTVASHLKDNVIKSLDRSVIIINRSRKFARKAREYKLTYSMMVYLKEGGDIAAAKDDIEHITKLFKVHRSAMDADYAFIIKA